MELKDYYAILGVERSDDLKAIKTAYRRLARKFHPDVSSEPEAEAKFKEVAEAYEVLKDPERREEYDNIWQHRNDPRYGAGAGSEGGYRSADTNEEFADYADFFSSVFGQRARQQPPRRGHDIETEVAVFLEEAQRGETRTLSFTLPQRNAFGSVIGETHKTLKVTIPAGVTDGEKIRLKGQGEPGSDGAPAGDLYLVIRIAPHPLFDVTGNDLEIVLPLAPWEAALGAKVSLPTLDGAILLSVPAGCQAGQRLRVKGKGLKSKKGQGDLYAVIKIVMPPKPDTQSEALWQQLAQANTGFDARNQWGKSS